MFKPFNFGYFGRQDPPHASASTQTESASTQTESASTQTESASTRTEFPEPIRLNFMRWIGLFLIGGLIGFITANHTVGSIKGFTKEKIWEETGEKYSVLTSAGELYAGVMSIGFGFAALAFAYYIIQKLNQYFAAHPELIASPPPPTPQPPPVPLTSEEKRRFETSIAALAGITLGFSTSLPTCIVINGFSKQKTSTNENGDETKYKVLTDDGALYILGLTIACGLVAAALAWYRKPICNQVVKFFSNGHSPETAPLIRGSSSPH